MQVTEPKPFVRSLLAWGVVVVVAALAIRWLCGAGIPFDAAQWRAEDDRSSRDGIRSAMADRLVRRRVLIGKSRAEVQAMLGEPVQHREFADWHLVYWLGPERAFPFPVLGAEYLLLRLSDEGRVCECRIMSDG